MSIQLPGFLQSALSALEGHKAPAAPPPGSPGAISGDAAVPPPGAMSGDSSPLPMSGDSSSIPLPPPGNSSGGPVAGQHFSSHGDPHETTLSGKHFDNQLTGEFVKFKATTGDFELQTRQEPMPGGNKHHHVTYNTAAAVKVNGQGGVVSYDLHTRQLLVNGKPAMLAPGQTVQVPGGGSVTASPTGFTVTSAAGDQVEVKVGKDHLDINGSVGPNRKPGEVTGELAGDGTNLDQSRVPAGAGILPGDAAAAGGAPAAGKGPDNPAPAAAPAAMDAGSIAQLLQQIEAMLAKMGPAPAPAAGAN